MGDDLRECSVDMEKLREAFQVTTEEVSSDPELLRIMADGVMKLLPRSGSPGSNGHSRRQRAAVVNDIVNTIFDDPQVVSLLHKRVQKDLNAEGSNCVRLAENGELGASPVQQRAPIPDRSVGRRSDAAAPTAAGGEKRSDPLQLSSSRVTSTEPSQERLLQSTDSEWSLGAPEELNAVAFQESNSMLHGSVGKTKRAEIKARCCPGGGELEQDGSPVELLIQFGDDASHPVRFEDLEMVEDDDDEEEGQQREGFTRPARPLAGDAVGGRGSDISVGMHTERRSSSMGSATRDSGRNADMPPPLHVRVGSAQHTDTVGIVSPSKHGQHRRRSPGGGQERLGSMLKGDDAWSEQGPQLPRDARAMSAPQTLTGPPLDLLHAIHDSGCFAKPDPELFSSVHSAGKGVDGPMVNGPDINPDLRKGGRRRDARHRRSASSVSDLLPPDSLSDLHEAISQQQSGEGGVGVGGGGDGRSTYIDEDGFEMPSFKPALSTVYSVDVHDDDDDGDADHVPPLGPTVDGLGRKCSSLSRSRAYHVDSEGAEEEGSSIGGSVQEWLTDEESGVLSPRFKGVVSPPARRPMPPQPPPPARVTRRGDEGDVYEDDYEDDEEECRIAVPPPHDKWPVRSSLKRTGRGAYTRLSAAHVTFREPELVKVHVYEGATIEDLPILFYSAREIDLFEMEAAGPVHDSDDDDEDIGAEAVDGGAAVKYAKGITSHGRKMSPVGGARSQTVVFDDADDI